MRPALATFAQDMENRLRANDYKGGWQNEPVHLLLAGAIEEVGEVLDALDGQQANPTFHAASRMLAHAAAELRQFGPFLKVGLKKLGYETNSEHPVLESADAANFLMMVADRTRGLQPFGSEAGVKP